MIFIEALSYFLTFCHPFNHQVNLSSQCEEVSEKNNEQQARVTILTQQQLRLNKDLRDLKNNLKVAR